MSNLQNNNNNLNNTKDKDLNMPKYVELYLQAKPCSQKRDKTTIDVEYEKQCDDCTF